MARAPQPIILDRQPPHSLEAERNVLGSVLISPECCDDLALLLRAEDFYSPANQKLFAHIMGMHDEGLPLDETLLVDRLKRSGDFEEIGGTLYLAEVALAVPTAANAAYYARIVQDKSLARSLILASTEIAGEAYAEEIEARDLLNKAEERIFAIHDAKWSGTVISMHDVLQEAFVHLDNRMKHGTATGVPTGFADLDGLTGGLHESELVILAARPSMGKTALATNIAEHATLGANTPTLFVSLEMARLELAQRMLCSRGKINGSKFRNGRISELDSRKLIEASAELSQGPLFIDDTPGRTLTEIAATARRLRRKGGLGLIIIDYLQLIEPDNPRDPRQEQVAKIARRLKALARELKVPVLCLAQLNRQAEASRDNIPRLSHLRESGAIEQDADVVMFVHRDEYYLTAEDRENPNNKHLLGLAEIIVAKQRNGPVGEVKLRWFQEYTRFENLAGEEYQFEDPF
ncbi:MAG: replicative DNA helicase [Planctomycetes bacterium]|nr:replicative DNA helicase [Planctomycetota bacterium]